MNEDYGQLSLFPPPLCGIDEAGTLRTTGTRIVYFYEDRAKGRIKIGFTATGNPETRGRQGNTWNLDLHLIGSIVVGDRQTDRFLHKRFACYWIEREWYRDCPELRRAIANLIEAQRDRSREQPIAIVVNGSVGDVVVSVDCRKCGAFLAFSLTCNVDQWDEGRLYDLGVVRCGRCDRRMATQITYNRQLRSGTYQDGLPQGGE